MARIRKSGLDFVGDIAWGTHMCQFYKTKQDLIDVLVPYFCDGLKNNESCVWVTSEFLDRQDVIEAMQKALPDFQSYLKKGQIEIFPYTEWYLKEGKFELQRVLKGWVEKHDKAIAAGYAELRVTGNPFWHSSSKDWKDFTEYEAQINKVIDNYKLLVLCTYSLDKCGANEIIDVVINHKFGMIKRAGKWTLIESSTQKKIEDALRKSESKFSDLYSSMTEGVAFHQVIKDKTGKIADYIITDVNPAYEKITGIPKEAVVGKKASESYGIKKPPYIDRYAKVVTTGKSTHFETYFPPMEKHFSISCISSSKGKFITVFHDITNNKKAEKELNKSFEKFKLLSETTSQLLASKNPQTSIENICINVMQYLNCNCFFNFLIDEAKGKLILNAHKGIPNKVIKEFEQIDIGEAICGKVAKHGKPIIIEDVQNSQDTRVKILKSYGIQAYATHPLISKGNILGTLSFGTKNHASFKTEEIELMNTIANQVATAIQRIINEQALKESKKQLEEYTNNLEALVEERAKQLKDTERLAAIGATAGMVGHDIRNPLQTVIGEVYLAKDELETLPNSETKNYLKECLDTISEQTIYVNKIVADLQDFARPLKPHIEKVDCKAIINNTISSIRIPPNIQTSISVCENFPKLDIDKLYLQRILQNLINNAIQAMPNGGKLTINTSTQKDQVSITVEDTGKGIPEEIKNKLFTPLVTTKAKGQGFGLAVIKRFTEALGGTVNFESQLDKGTKFTVNLPIKK
jgi:signal transduction histidine kinase/PAS domain-containing protein